MSFNEKLQKLRKENKLSQEELASKLDITRQSVSKWESGQTYPEMDKLLAICKIFNCTLEELTNDEIKDFNKEEKKSNFNSLIDSILEYVNKTYKFFTTSTFKEIIKCIFIMLIVGLILSLLSIPIDHLEYQISNAIYMLGTSTFTRFISGIFYILLDAVYYFLFILLLIYIFKIGFLDKVEDYDKVNNPEDNKQDGFVNNETVPTVKNRTDRRQLNIFNGLGKIIIFFLKLLLIFLVLPFICLVIIFCAALVVEIYLMFKGIIYISILIGLIFLIILTMLIIEFTFDLLFNKLIPFKRMLITLLGCLVGLGVASGILMLDISNTTYYDYLPKLDSTTDTYEYEFNNEMMFNDYYFNSDETNYIVDNTLGTKIKVSITYYKDFNKVTLNEFNNIYTFSFDQSSDYKKYFNIIIDNLKDKNIYNYEKLSSYQINIYGTQDQLNTIKANYNTYIEEENESIYQSEYDSCQETLYEQQNEIDDLNGQISDLQQQKDELQSQLEDYKQRIQDLLD